MASTKVPIVLKSFRLFSNTVVKYRIYCTTYSIWDELSPTSSDWHILHQQDAAAASGTQIDIDPVNEQTCSAFALVIHENGGTGYTGADELELYGVETSNR